MLERFLTNLSIPLIAVLRDSQSFVTAAGLGIGICEMPAYLVGQDVAQLERIIDWLDRWRVRKSEASRSSQFEHLASSQPDPAHLHHRH